MTIIPYDKAILTRLKALSENPGESDDCHSHRSHTWQHHTHSVRNTTQSLKMIIIRRKKFGSTTSIIIIIIIIIVIMIIIIGMNIKIHPFVERCN